MTTTADTFTALAAKAAEAQRAANEAAEALAREQQAQNDTIAEAQRAWRDALVDAGRSRDEALAEAQAEAYTTAEQLVGAGDIIGAFREFTRYKATIRARAELRNDGVNAANANGREPFTRADYTDRSKGWDTFLAEKVEQAATANGLAMAADLVGDMPASYDEARAYLDA